MSFRNLRVITLAAAAFASALVARAQLKVGDSFPALATADVVAIDGGALPATAGKVTLVDFWASWCAPCRASFAALASLHKEYGPQGLQIIAVSIDERAKDAGEFWKRQAAPFVGAHDRKQKLVQQVVVPTMPSSYLLDANGKIRFINEGFHGELGTLRTQIESLLKPKT